MLGSLSKNLSERVRRMAEDFTSLAPCLVRKETEEDIVNLSTKLEILIHEARKLDQRLMSELGRRSLNEPNNQMD